MITDRLKTITPFFLIVLFIGHPILAQPDTPLWMPSESTSHRESVVTSIPIGESIRVAELEGPAIIRHIWITTKCSIPQIQHMLVLRVWWDGEEEPSIEVPLGDFFGVGFGKEVHFQSAMVEMFPAGGEQHSSLNSYWEMPFHKSARIEVENRSNRTVSMLFFQADYEKVQALPENALHLHAQYRRENPVQPGVPYTILEATGRGNYVGTIMNYHLLGPGAWVEGGQSFYIDGEKEPSLPGTGGEDYFGHAWGFRMETNSPYHGTSYGPKDNKMTAYRFHVPDPVRFEKSIRATLRCHGWDVGDRQDDYSSVALWYQTEPHAPFPPLPPVDYDWLEVAPEFRENPLDIINKARKALPFEGKNLALDYADYRESGHFDIDGLGSFAFDGDIGTKWCEIENPDDHWLAVDLGKTAEIEGFVLLTPSATGDSEHFDVVEFAIEKGQSFEGPWEPVVKVDRREEELPPAPGTTGMFVLPLQEPVKGRYFKLLITKSCWVDPICRIQEWEIYGNFHK